jgi:hypothetical protein
MRLAAALVFALALALPATGCGDGTTCNTVAADVGEICLPDSIAPGNESVIEVRELCGPGCAQQPGCDAQLENGQLILDVHEDVCSGGFGATCQFNPCQRRIVRCRLPALAEGDYAVVAPGSPAQILHVRTGGQGSCSLPVN